MRRMEAAHWRIGLLTAAMMLTGCSMIDEDLSDCGNQAELDYELRLITNINTELETKLNTQTDIGLANELRHHLEDIFTDFAHDVDLSFYDTHGDSLRLEHERHIMDANQASYALTLPMREYMHLAAANLTDNHLVTLEEDERCHTSVLQQARRDTIDSHTTGLFTARLPMDVKEGVDQTFNVRLYMANCAAALVIDPKDYETDGIRVFSKGFATGFSICDSTYAFAQDDPVVRTTRIEAPDNDNRLAFCSVTFPSRRLGETRTIIETTEPFISKEGDEVLWEFAVFVKLPDGTVTRTVLGLKQPLSAGELKIITCWIGQQGVVLTDRQDVAVSITTDWKEGMGQDVVI